MTENSSPYADRSWMTQSNLPSTGYTNWASVPPVGPPPAEPVAPTLTAPPSYNTSTIPVGFPAQNTAPVVTTQAWRTPVVQRVPADGSRGQRCTNVNCDRNRRSYITCGIILLAAIPAIVFWLIR